MAVQRVDESGMVRGFNLPIANTMTGSIDINAVLAGSKFCYKHTTMVADELQWSYK